MLDAGAADRAARLGCADLDAAELLRDAQLARLRGPHRREAEDAQQGALHFAVRPELLVDGGHGVGADGEADAGGRAPDDPVQRDRGVHADHLALEVEEGTAAVPVRDRRVGLDRPKDGRPFVDCPVLRRHDAARHREPGAVSALEVEREADGDDVLADDDLVERAERQRMEVAAVDLEQRDVGARVRAHEVGLEHGTVEHRDLDRDA